MQANKDADENKAFKDSRIDKDVSKSITFIQKRANDGAVKPSGFGWVSGDGKSELNLTGRIHMDTRFFNNMVPDGSESDPDAVNTGNQMDFRRARLGFTGKFWNDFNYEMVWNGNAIGGSGSTANIDTGWLNYSAKKESRRQVDIFRSQAVLQQISGKQPDGQINSFMSVWPVHRVLTTREPLGRQKLITFAQSRAA
jgi:hypothetical protein